MAGEDFWKTVPELGLISSERAPAGIVNVTDDAETFCPEKNPVKILPKVTKLNAIIATSVFPPTNKPGRRANGFVQFVIFDIGPIFSVLHLRPTSLRLLLRAAAIFTTRKGGVARPFCV